ncbi:MAG: tRNA(His) guanylyltransferase Thg1 family protein [Lachnospiraceae bacterium]|nr:tRNA(His) guanylyltransferase Thg1 family protein [Lachnospiraceae bacterium]
MRLDARMKRYEEVSKNYLTRRIPVILRLDGRCFHKFTEGMIRPFDDKILLQAMRNSMLRMCEEIPGCVMGYHQSDEVTLVLVDYQSNDTYAWFEYNVQKLTSNAASMMTGFFMEEFNDIVSNINEQAVLDLSHGRTVDYYPENFGEAYLNKVFKARFDCKAFNIPKDEVVNNLIWRQQDATRNSLSQLAHSEFSYDELHKKKNSEIQDMLVLQRGINWNNLPTRLKRGTTCIKEPDSRGKLRWKLDYEPPIFTKDREYINSRIYIED